jgi:hypothetical protein
MIKTNNMNLKEILSVSGYSGLFKFVSQGRNCIIVESLDDKRRISVFTSTKAISLEDISMYTEDKDVPLIEILKNISAIAGTGEAISPKASNVELKEYFEKVLPSYDRDRVYVSDMKKVFSWYNQLLKHGLLVFDEEKPEEVQNEKEIKE